MSDEVSLYDLWRILVNSKIFFLTVFLLLSFSGSLYIFTQPKLYIFSQVVKLPTYQPVKVNQSNEYELDTRKPIVNFEELAWYLDNIYLPTKIHEASSNTQQIWKNIQIQPMKFDNYNSYYILTKIKLSSTEDKKLTETINTLSTDLQAFFIAKNDWIKK